MEGQPETLRMLGSDGSGNPICFDATKDRIVLCDHERDFKPIPMNSSVEKLLLSLAAYGEWWDANVGDAEPSRAARAALRATLKKVDPSAWTRGAFWTGA
ncbi:MAG: SUKH-4 family immunity protein [Myxococcaceae bacterium]